MEAVGLVPSSTGEPGGKKSGQSVTHYIEKGGLFEQKTTLLIKKGFLLPFVERVKQDVRSYTIEEMKTIEVPGKPGLYKTDEGSIIKGMAVKSGLNTDGTEIIKVVVDEPERIRHLKARYVCGCHRSSVYGKPGLDIKCNVCKKPFVCTNADLFNFNNVMEEEE